MVESSSSVTVAGPNVTSVTVAVHCGFGHEPGGAAGVSVLTVDRAWPLRGVGKGPLCPVAVVSKVCPGATLPAGLVQVTVAVPGADTRIVKVVPPRPATLPVHWTCVPMSRQVGSPTKCPACANAAPEGGEQAQRGNGGYQHPRNGTLHVCYFPQCRRFLAGRAVVPARHEEPMFGVEVENQVTAQKAQGIAWPPASPQRGLRCRPLAQTRAVLTAARRAGQDSSRKVHFEFSLV
jgi:hypothetical protein